MRALVVALTAAGWLTAMSAVDGLDVRGSVRANGRLQLNTVVWLEAPRAAPPPSAAKIVLDQRNLTSTHVSRGARRHDRGFSQ